MDWVKPKHRARQLRQTDSSESAVAASVWLKQLCEENVALLQSSLPVQTKRLKSKPEAVEIEHYLRAMVWGIGTWEVENRSHPEFLGDLIEAFGPANVAPSSLLSKKRKSAKQKEKRSESLVSATGLPLAQHQVAQAKKIGKWISQQLPKSGHDPYVALVCAGWIHALPDVGRDIPPALWLEVLQCALTQVDRAWEAGPVDGLYPWIVWACEVPLALAKQLSHLGSQDRIVSETLNRIALLLEESADDPRLFLSRGGQDLRALLACIVRCRWSADAVGARKWYPPQRKALGKLAIAMLALSDPQGHSMLFDEKDTQHDDHLWSAISQLVGDNKKLTLAASCALPDSVGKLLGLKPSKLRKDKTLDASLPKPSHYWEKNSVVSMRRSWRDLGCRVAVDFSTDVIWLDVLGEDGKRIFCGDWDVEVTRDNQSVPVDVAWQEVCWFTDDDVDYLELECDLEGVCKIQRQVMLMREEGIVYFADALIAEADGEWTIKSTWNMADGIQLHSEPKTNECKLLRIQSDDTSAKPAALLLPVAMPEWRRSPSGARLTGKGQQVVLQSTVKGKSMYSPLVMSLRGNQKSNAYTWRQLTVAEDLQIQSRDKAEAYRVQINKDQWVFYRSLTPCIRRTVMGLHLNTEFYAARFCASDGQYEALIEVNPE